MLARLRSATAFPMTGPLGLPPGRACRVLLGALLIAAACGGDRAGPLAPPPAAPAPVHSELSPSIVAADLGSPVRLVVTGSGFTTTSRIRWNGIERATEFVSATELRMTVPPSDVAAAGVIAITVRTPAPGGGESTAASLTIVQPAAPAPTIAFLEPSRIVVGWGMPFTVVITGSGFIGTTQLHVGGTERAIEQRTASTLSFRISPAEVASARAIPIRVVNPAPGGGFAEAAFMVNAVPVATVRIASPFGAGWTWVGLGLPLEAEARSATGAVLTDRLAAWQITSDEAVTIASTGPRTVTVYGAKPGQAGIRSTMGDVSTQTDIAVFAAPTHDLVFASGLPGDRYIGIWSPVTGNAPRRLAVGMQATHPAPSPDGTHLVFSSVPSDGESMDLYVVRRDGSDRRRLTADASVDISAAWSPDGQRLAWTSSRANGTLDIWTMRPDGTEARQLTHSRLVDPVAGSGNAATTPAWSPDGRRLAYTVGHAGRSHVWVMNADGTGKRQLTHHQTADDYEPAWSPDGQSIGFRRVGRTVPTTTLWRVHAETGADLLTPFIGEVSEAGTPSWSPDGAWLTMSSEVAGGAPALFAVPATFDRGTRIVIPAGSGGIRHARWIRR